MKKVLAVICALVLFSGVSFAANPSTVTATAVIVAPLEILSVTNLHFGTMISPVAASTATLAATASPTPSITGGMTHLGGHQGGVFTIKGNVSTPVNIALSKTTLSLISGANNMPATISLSSTSPTLNGTGDATVYIGGVLNVGVTQAPGTYTDSFTVTVSY